MKNFIQSSVLVFISINCCQTAFAQPAMRGDGPAPEAAEFRIVKADPALDALIASDAELELMADGFGLNEGPVWVRDGGAGLRLARVRVRSKRFGGRGSDSAAVIGKGR